MNNNNFSDFDTKDQELLKGLKFLDINKINGMNSGASALDIKTNKSFEEMSNEYAMGSPFGKQSLFYTEPDGSFVLTNVDAKQLIEYIKQGLAEKKIVNFEYWKLPISLNSQVVEINNEIFNVRILLNSKVGELDFSINPSFTFSFDFDSQKLVFTLLFPYKKYKDNKDENKYAIKLSFFKGINLQTVLTYLNKDLIQNSKETLKKTFQKAFNSAQRNTNYLDFLYETAPDFVLNDRKDEDLYIDLELLSKESIDTIGTDENIAILNIVNAIKDAKKFAEKINENPNIVQNLFENFNEKYIDKLIHSFSKIGYKFWTKEDKEQAWSFELDYKTKFKEKDNYYDSYVISTSFSYYQEHLKMYKVGTTIFTYMDHFSTMPDISKEIGPDELQFAFEPVALYLEKDILFIPIFVAEYFTNKKKCL